MYGVFSTDYSIYARDGIASVLFRAFLFQIMSKSTQNVKGRRGSLRVHTQPLLILPHEQAFVGVDYSRVFTSMEVMVDPKWSIIPATRASLVRRPNCCCLDIKPFFLPNISSTPSVYPYSS